MKVSSNNKDITNGYNSCKGHNTTFFSIRTSTFTESRTCIFFFFTKHPTCYEYVVKAEIPRISGYPHPVIFRTSGPSRNTRPPRAGEQPPSDARRSSILLFSSYNPPPRLPLALLSWTPMETVASWHGEVNYKRYQSLGVVGWLVGLGSTDSQLPLRADPRARAIPSSLALLPSLPLSYPLSLCLTLSSSLLPRLFLSYSPRLRLSFVDPSSSPHVSDEPRRFDAPGAM